MKLPTFFSLSIGGGLIFILGILFGRIGTPPADSSPSSCSVSEIATSLSSSQYLKKNQPAAVSLPSPQEASSFKFSELIVTLGSFPPGPQREMYRQAILRDWAQRDPARAFAYAQALSPKNEAYLTAVFQGWAENDADGAWASALTTGPYAIEAVVEAVGKSAPEKLEGFLGDLDLTNDENVRVIFVKGVCSMVANGLTPEAIQAASQVEEPEYRRESFNTILLGLLEEEVTEDIATEVLLSFPTEKDRTDAASAVSRMMAEDSPVGATFWAASLPIGTETRRRALHQSVTEWFEHDFRSTMDWLNDNSMDPDLDNVVAYIALNEKLVDHTPEISMQWVESIHDETIRFDGIVQVAGMWAETDPDPALRYLDESQLLSPAQKESARKEVQRILDAP